MAIAGTLSINVVGHTADFERAMARTRQQVHDTSRVIHQGQSAFSALGKQVMGLAAGFVSLAAAKRAAESLVSANVQAQSLAMTFQAITGSAAKAGQTLANLRSFANETGQSFSTLAGSFKGIAAAAEGTALAGEGARTVLEGFTRTMQRQGLSNEAVQGSFLALSQMISKGTVLAEEFRGQLGERLPNALQVAARVMGVTTKEFSLMMKEGDVIPSVLLPRMAREFTRMSEGQPPINNLTTATNRLKNAWEELAASPAVTNFVKRLTDSMPHLVTVLRLLDETMRGLSGASSPDVVALQRSYPQLTDKIGAAPEVAQLDAAAAKIFAAQAQLKRAEDSLKQIAKDPLAAIMLDAAKAAVDVAREDLQETEGAYKKILASLTARVESTAKTLAQAKPKPVDENIQRGIELQQTLNSAMEDYELAMQRIQDRLARNPNYREQALKDEIAAGEALEKQYERILAREKALIPYLPQAGAGAATAAQLPGGGALAMRESPYTALIQQSAARHKEDAALISNLIYRESGFNARARGKDGERGLGQIMPGTGTRLGLHTDADYFDPGKNIDATAKYVAQMRSILRQKFGVLEDETRLVLAAYNAGIGNVSDAIEATTKAGQVPTFANVLPRLPMPGTTGPHVKNIYGGGSVAASAPAPGASLGVGPETQLAAIRERLRLNELEVKTLANQETRLKQLFDLYDDIDKLAMSPDAYEASLFDRMQLQATQMSKWRQLLMEHPKEAMEGLEDEIPLMQERVAAVFLDVTRDIMRASLQSNLHSLIAEASAAVQRFQHETMAGNLALQFPDDAARVGLPPEGIAAQAGRFVPTQRAQQASQDIAMVARMEALGLATDEYAAALARVRAAEASQAGAEFLQQLQDEYDMLTLTTAALQARALADKGVEPAAIAKAEGLRQSIALMQDMKKVSSTVIDALVEMAATGEVSFKNLASSFLRMVLNMTVEASGLKKMLADLLSQGAQAGINWLGLATSAVSAAAGGSSGGTDYYGAGMAAGGPVQSASRYLVGEVRPELFVSKRGLVAMVGMKGPELFAPPEAGEIVPLDQIHSRLPALLKATAPPQWRPASRQHNVATCRSLLWRRTRGRRAGDARSVL